MDDWKDDDKALASHWSDSVQLKEEHIMKGEHFLVSFPVRWTSCSQEDVVAVSHSRQEEIPEQRSCFLVERVQDNLHTSLKQKPFQNRPMDAVGSVLLQCQSNGEMKVTSLSVVPL